MQRREIDEHKIIPLLLGVASYGLLMAGLIGWGTPQSGYFGVEEGDYAYQHAEMNVGWQALGLAVCIAAGLVTAWILAFVLERTVGLRAPEEAIVGGYDRYYWGIEHDVADLPDESGNGAPVPVDRESARPQEVRPGAD
jgi:ammonia channel protein AmtB